MKQLIFPNPFGHLKTSEEIVNSFQERYGFSSSISNFFRTQNGFNHRIFTKSLKQNHLDCKKYLGKSEDESQISGSGTNELPAIKPNGEYNCQRDIEDTKYLNLYYFPIGMDFSANIFVEVLRGKYKGWIGNLDKIALSCETIEEFSATLGIENFSELTLDQQADAIIDNGEFFLFVCPSFDSLLANIYLDPSNDWSMKIRSCPDPRMKTEPTEQNAMPTIEQLQLMAQSDPEAQHRLGWLYQRGDGIPRDEVKAYSLLEKAASQGYAQAQVDVGFFYRYNHSTVVTQNYSVARQWFEKAAALGNAKGQAALGDLFRQGLGVAQDEEKARYWYGLSAAQGDLEAMVSLGLLVEDEHEMFSWWLKAAELENESAQEILWERHNSLHRYANDRFDLGDHAQALRVWELLASQRDSDAARRLELFYTDGEATAPNEAVANQWAAKAWALDKEDERHEENQARADGDLERRAAQGDASAQFAMGNRYAWGRSGFAMAMGISALEQDDALASQWYEKAAAQGHMLAQESMGLCCDKGVGVPQDYTQARMWFERAAAQGSVDAQFYLGLMFQNAEGVTQDFARAAQWFEKAAAQGHAKAQVNLAAMYDSGRGVNQDLDQSRYWMEQAALSGNERAQLALGSFYDLGHGVEQDYAQARHWYSLAAAQGNAMAQFTLGRLFLCGLGVAQDVAEGRQWLEKAVANGSVEARTVLDQLASNEQ